MIGLLYRRVLLAIFVSFLLIGCSSKSSSVGNNSGSSGFQKPKKGTPATMRPYTVRGKTYYPQTVKVGDTQKGLASWYGPGFHGKNTSNGERYDMHAQTAAHKTYPMNTMVKVTNSNTGKSTVVRINDRGPFVNGRIIDLSKKAANDIDVFAGGTAPVKLEVVGFYGKTATSATPQKDRVFVGGDFMVQIGAFKNKTGAEIYKAQYDGESGYKTVVKEFSIDGLYRVFLIGFKSEEEARDFAYSTHINGAFVVRQ